MSGKSKKSMKTVTLYLDEPFHRKFKTIASSQGKTFKQLFFDVGEEFFQKPENEKILATMTNGN